MTIPIHMPALSPTMETGNLTRWLVKEGDSVSSGDFLAEIETDKATMEIESIDEGIVGKILVAEGAEDVPVGTLIMVLLEEGESASDISDSEEAGEAAAKPAEPAPAPAPAAAAAPQKAATPKAATPKPAAPAALAASTTRLKASPLAKRLAAEAGIDISVLDGSGPGGRIIKADVEAAKSGAAPVARAPAAAAASGMGEVLPPPDGVPFEETRLSGMRKIIAKRLTHAKQTVPHFYLTMDAEIDRMLELRKRLNAKLADEGAKDRVTKISVNDFIIRAVAVALMKVPDANVQFGGDVMYRFSRADISVAVATPGGLITPVIRGAEAKGLAEISAEVKDLAARAQEGKLAPEEYQGGTFSISNLGMFGVKEFSAVINPPQGAILAVGAGEPRAIVRHGAVQTATVMSMTLSCDHRAIDGAVGAKFLGVLKGYLEEPGSMLL